MLRLLLPVFVSSLVVLTAMAWAAKPDPIAWYSFDDSEAPGKNELGAELSATVSDAKSDAGRRGKGLRLGGAGGLEIPSDLRLHAEGGFAIELWVRFDTVDLNMNVITKADECGSTPRRRAAISPSSSMWAGPSSPAYAARGPSPVCGTTSSPPGMG